MSEKYEIVILSEELREKLGLCDNEVMTALFRDDGKIIINIIKEEGEEEEDDDDEIMRLFHLAHDYA